jgi:hypothetical protein
MVEVSHKSIPCPKCDRIWLWESNKDPRNAYCPEGYGCRSDNSKTDIAEIKKNVEELKRDIAWIVQYLLKQNEPISPPPFVPTMPSLGDYKCFKCGMTWSGTAMSYYCSNIYCPIQVKVTSQTYNTPITSVPGDFGIESPDPAKRSWYYDGDGTKRKKEE